jgi:NADH:ubiquinone oxidoreductase subunit
MSDPKSRASFRQLGGLRGFWRNPGLVLMTLRRGREVGTDALGNRFFERPGAAGARARRWVVYAGVPDASVIGPRWHAWLHYTSELPLLETAELPWQKPHQPNLTGTPAGYRPPGHDYEGGKRAAASGDYQSWTPDL